MTLWCLITATLKKSCGSPRSLSPALLKWTLRCLRRPQAAYRHLETNENQSDGNALWLDPVQVSQKASTCLTTLAPSDTLAPQATLKTVICLRKGPVNVCKGRQSCWPVDQKKRALSPKPSGLSTAFHAVIRAQAAAGFSYHLATGLSFCCKAAKRSLSVAYYSVSM